MNTRFRSKEQSFIMIPTGACTCACRPNRTRSMTLPARIHEDEVLEQKISYCPRNSEDVGNTSTWNLAAICQTTRWHAATGQRFFTMHFVPLLHYLIYGMAFENNSLNIKCVPFSPQLSSKIYLILRRIRRHTFNVYMSVRKAPVILVRYQWNVNFLERFFENTEIIKFY